MDLEAVLLSGGASSRMGVDKALITVGGQPMSLRIADALAEAVDKVTILGQSPIGNYAFQPDAEQYAGPLSALRTFVPVAEHIFVCSCDLPLFERRVVTLLRHELGGFQAIVPLVDNFPQPLCGLYSRSAFDVLRAMGTDQRSMMAWLDHLDVRLVEPSAIGIDVRWITGCNTPEELGALLQQADR